MLRAICVYAASAILSAFLVPGAAWSGDTFADGDNGRPAIRTAADDGQGLEARGCRPLDVREFGLISDGSISAAWTEAVLIEKFGPPCEIISLGYLKGTGPDPRGGKTGSTTEQYLEKKQYIYRGDYSSRTTVITIIDGKVAKKERVDE